MVKLVRQFASGIYNLVLGLFTTGKHLGRHAITVQYPKERWEVPERSRGMVVLLTDHETGKLNCTACLLCMRACPTAAIRIDVFKDENKKRQLGAFNLDFNLCCFCGLCEEACNFAGIKLSTAYEFPEFEHDKLIYDMDKLTRMGIDVPYEKPVKKTPAAKPKPAAAPDAKAAEKPAEKPAEATPEAKPAEKPEAASGEKAETEKPAEGPPADAPADTPKPEPPADSDPDKKEGEG